MEEINRLHDIADDIASMSWGYELASALHNIAAGIGEKVDGMRRVGEYEDDVLTFVEAYGGLEEVKGHMMPEGMEWPRYESGEFVKFGDELEQHEQGHRFRVDAVKFMADGWRACHEIDGVRDVYRPGERVKRPAPKVLDADGVKIELGDDLYSVEGSLKFHVGHIDRVNGKIATGAMFAIDKWADPAMYTHRAPVLAADGKPLREGETVWRVRKDMGQLEFFEYEHPWARVKDEQGKIHGLLPDDLTHERPDSFQKLWDDLECGDVSEYEFMRRAKAIAKGGE